jgi:hypothetical protein
MIISASRRTDIPAYYTDWLLNRLKERYVYVRNPFNIRQINKIDLNPAVVDGIVFWSKNPRPLLDKLHLITDYPYYFHFTLNAYDTDIEVRLPQKKELVETFKRLSDKIGPQRVIWRYDPVVVNDRYTASYHIDAFGEYAHTLRGYTNKVTFSFIDLYKKIAQHMRFLGITEVSNEEKHVIARNFSEIAKENGLHIDSCAEKIDLSAYGIDHARCIDSSLIAEVAGYAVSAQKDPYQRLACGCIDSIDIGEYNSCRSGCIYCYATYSRYMVETQTKRHDPLLPLLVGELQGDEKLTEKQVSSNRIIQQELF